MVACARVLLPFIVPVAMAQQPSPPATATESPFLPVPAVSSSVEFGAQLPPFEARDISGRTWRSEDLLGKFTVILIWHTFWARAADAHPRAHPNLPDLSELQRFYDKTRNTNNVQVLAFCLDYDYTHAPAYMKQKQYTFPVIADRVLIDKLFPEAAGRPPYWLVNPAGRLSYPLRSWSFGGLLYQVERAAAQN